MKTTTKYIIEYSDRIKGQLLYGKWAIWTECDTEEQAIERLEAGIEKLGNLYEFKGYKEITTLERLEFGYR